MPPLAIAAGAAVIGAGGSIIAANKNSKAIDKSTDASLQANRESLAAQKEALDKTLGFQTQAYNNSGQLQTDVRNQNVAILNPYAQTGYAAMNQINALLGLPEQQAYHAQPITFNPITNPATPAASTATNAANAATAPRPMNALSAPPNNLLTSLQANGR